MFWEAKLEVGRERMSTLMGVFGIVREVGERKKMDYNEEERFSSKFYF